MVDEMFFLIANECFHGAENNYTNVVLSIYVLGLVRYGELYETTIIPELKKRKDQKKEIRRDAISRCKTRKVDGDTMLLQAVLHVQ